MTDPAATLEAILLAENQALERHDAEAAVSFLKAKSAAAQALSPDCISPELGERLRDLSARNQLLLERALQVQGEIVAMVVRAAKNAPAGPRYSAAGASVPADSRAALIRQA